MDLKKLDLLDFGDELLQRPPKFFDATEHDAKEVCDALFAKQKSLGGIGLSANQVGLDMRVFVFGDNTHSPGKATKGLVRYVINPEVIDVGMETEALKEGCLSLPGVSLVVRRPTSVTASYQDVTGDNVTETFTGISARVFLHEYDHMIGQNFTQRVSKLKLDRAVKSIKKKVRHQQRHGVI
tara:strand:+ start:881 stop:1426 length:546 start_codon:yes stop_codon:yes gene_type:complete